MQPVWVFSLRKYGVESGRMLNMKRTVIFFIGCIFLVQATTSGCSGLPLNLSGMTPEVSAQVATSANSSQMLATLTITPSLGEVPIVLETNVPAPTLLESIPEAPASAPGRCDHVAPGHPIDVTILDGASVQPGESFSKTWRLVNAGTCAWTKDYSVVYFSGQLFGAVVEQSLSTQVTPGEVLEITVDMIAPEIPGEYRSNWKLRSPDGALFGLGPDGDAPFWVKIAVVQASTETPAPQTVIVTPLPVYFSAAINIALNEGIDLDSGKLNHGDQNDLLYMPAGDGSLALEPQNGARAAVFGSQPPVGEECQEAVLESATLALVESSEAQYVCYRTSQGLPGYLRLEVEATPEQPLTVDFVTWMMP